MMIRIYPAVIVLFWILQGPVCIGSQGPPPDLLIEYRIAGLDTATPVPLDYNEHVRDFVRLFSEDRNEAFARVLGLTSLYFPVFENIFDKYGIPLEVRYIAIVESALDPFAVSPSGAVGLWQFLPHTARMFDLEITSYIDERRDIFKSTEAAARYMKYLYDMFGDWHLVFAAYNSGPGAVRNAIERSGGSTRYWEIRRFLPEQSQRFIPAFIAVNYLAKYYEDHGITPVHSGFAFNDIDTVHVTRQLSLTQISGGLGICIDTLRFLNPVYRLDHIPSGGEKRPLVLPSRYVAPFIQNYERLYVYGHAGRMGIDSGAVNGSLVRLIHRVRQGDFIHKIAMLYGTQPSMINQWNSLNDDRIFEGQELTIWIPQNRLNMIDPDLPFFLDESSFSGP